MGKIILCTGIEKNIGVTTISLLLGKSMAEILKKKVLAVDLNIYNPEYSKILTRGNDRATYNIDTVMSFALSGNINNVIKGNVEYMNHSNLEVLMGTNMKTGYKEEQYAEFMYEISKMYDLVIIDSCLDSIHQKVIDYSDMILCIINPSLKLLNDYNDKYWKLLKDDRTYVLLNRHENGVMSLKDIKDRLKKEVSYIVHYDKRVINNINKGDLDIGESVAQDDISRVATEILKRYNMVDSRNWLERLLNVKKGEKNNAMAKK